MITLAFIALGFLIGNLVGFTAGTITASFVPLLFAFGGGSAIAFMKKLSSEERRAAAGAVLSFSIGCIFGLYVGLIVSERQLLTPAEFRGDPVANVLAEALENEEDPETKRIVAKAFGEWQTKKDATVQGTRYLRSGKVKAAHTIDKRLHSQEITLESLKKAYEQMYGLATSDSL